MDGKLFYKELELLRFTKESEEALSARCGISKTTLNNWRRGTSEVQEKTVRRVLSRLGLTSDEIDRRLRALLGVPEPITREDVIKDLLRDSISDVLVNNGFETDNPVYIEMLDLSDQFGDALLSRTNRVDGIVSFSIKDSGEFSTVPCREFRLAPDGESLADALQSVTLYAFRKDWLHKVNPDPNQVFMSVMRGQSMVPTLTDGDILLIDQSRTAVQSGKIYAFREGALIRVRRLVEMPGGIRVIADNVREFPHYEITDFSQVELYGQVVWVGKTLVELDEPDT